MKIVGFDTAAWPAPMECTILGAVHHDWFAAGLRLRLEPGLPRSVLGMGWGRDIQEVLVFPRHIGASLTPRLSEDPCHVHVCSSEEYDPHEPIKPLVWALLGTTPSAP